LCTFAHSVIDFPEYTFLQTYQYCPQRLNGRDAKGNEHMTNLQNYAAPAGRLLLAFIFIMAGAQKITGYVGT